MQRDYTEEGYLQRADEAFHEDAPETCSVCDEELCQHSQCVNRECINADCDRCSPVRVSHAA